LLALSTSHPPRSLVREVVRALSGFPVDPPELFLASQENGPVLGFWPVSNLARWRLEPTGRGMVRGIVYRGRAWDYCLAILSYIV